MYDEGRRSRREVICGGGPTRLAVKEVVVNMMNVVAVAAADVME